MKTISVACGDSSPGGRAKGLLQIGAAKKNGGRGKPRPYVTTNDERALF